MESTKPLCVTVAGGGITGPAAALALVRAGHDVTLHEQRQPHEVTSPGVLSVTAPVRRALAQLGVRLPVRAVSPGRCRVIWADLHEALIEALPEGVARFGAKAPEDPEPGGLLIHADGVARAVKRTSFEYAGYAVYRGVSDVAGEDDAWHQAYVRGEYVINAQRTRSGGMWWSFYLPEPLVARRTMSGLSGDGNGGEPSERYERVMREAERLLPPMFQRWVLATREVQASPVGDWGVPAQLVSAGGRVVCMGDAAMPVRPHTGAGANLGLREALTLPEALAAGDLDGWERRAIRRRADQHRRGVSLGAQYMGA